MANRVKLHGVLLWLLLAGFSIGSHAQNLYFPPLTGTSWETVPPATLGWDTTRLDDLYQLLAMQKTRAFLLLKDGRIAVEKYFGTFGQDSAWYWASAGKTLTSLLVGIAQREGYLSIEDTTSEWLGEGWTSLPAENEQRITIRHQLTMTSGLDDGVADPYCTEPACLQYLVDAGTRWAYHNAPYTLLDSVLRNSTGRTLNQYFLSKVAGITGMTGIFLRSGYNNVFFSTPRSMARFGLLILNKGRWNATEVLADSQYFADMVNTSQELNLAYGYLWWLNGKASYMLPQTRIVFPGPLNPAAPQDMIAALGKNGQFINVVPGMGLVFIRMGDAPDSALVPFMLNNQIWEKLNDILKPERSYAMMAGWNLVSVPQLLTDYSRAVLFPSAVSDAIGFDSGYVTHPELAGGRGYWMKFIGPDTVTMTGTLCIADTLDLRPGWNLVGSIGSEVQAGTIRKIPDDLTLSPLYGYGEGGYHIATVLMPGRGYWIKSSTGGQIVLESASAHAGVEILPASSENARPR